MAFVPFSFQTSASYKGVYFQGYSLNENADEMMKLGFDIVTKPALDNDYITKMKARYEVSARNMFKQTGMRAFYYMYNTLFADHPYSKVRNTEESIRSITRDNIKALHAKYVRPDRLTILMVGDMKPEEMKKLANKYFGKWKVSKPAPKWSRFLL
jgi:predicted Zn-dependent peptidase